MNYTEIIDAALGYSDRTDQEVIDKMDIFLKVVESRINKAFVVGDMAIRATITTNNGQEYYGFPDGLSELRDIEIKDTIDSIERQTLQYLTPEQMNNRAAIASGDVNYTIVADQFQIYPPQDGRILEIIYYGRLPALTASAANNWLSDINPEAYIFGLLVEINSFVKDADAASLWDGRFAETIEAIDKKDKQSRWSGTPMQIRLG